jgi:hypothetical protein
MLGDDDGLCSHLVVPVPVLAARVLPTDVRLVSTWRVASGACAARDSIRHGQTLSIYMSFLCRPLKFHVPVSHVFCAVTTQVWCQQFVGNDQWNKHGERENSSIARKRVPPHPHSRFSWYVVVRSRGGVEFLSQPAKNFSAFIEPEGSL